MPTIVKDGVVDQAAFDQYVLGLEVKIGRMKRALRQAETVMMIVEPRSHKAEYLAALAAVREAMAP